MEFLGINTGSEWFQWVILPLFIFLARIGDQTIGTLRLIFLSKGYRYIAPVLGFFEVIIWILAISQIMKHLDNVMCYVAYGSGFAMGNFIGISLEQKISLGTVIIRIILKKENTELIEVLKTHNYGHTLVDAEGARGRVKIIFSTIKRKDIGHFLAVLEKYEPDAFYTIEDVKTAKEGVFRNSKRRSVFDSFSFRLMKSK
ncbi:MAG: DUF2179 domain-containing protein [Bacteroidetes bacterium]|nr:DUF2179 domain-containing protein [Bacteroidota bacterium]